jgi:hypothetical protein
MFGRTNLTLIIGLTLGMLKNLILYCSLLLTVVSCNSHSPAEKADNPLDGGRYFIENYLQGDMIKAQQYLLVDAKNQSYFDQMTKDYFAMDKEGRMQTRQASIQIDEVKALDDKASVIYYQSSNNKIQRWIKVVSTPDGWKVDLKFSYGAKL